MAQLGVDYISLSVGGKFEDAVHRPGQPTRTLGMDDTLDGEDVVPGWTLPVRDLFDQS